MRKLKLLLAASALFCVTAVHAQKDVTSQYIKNATLSQFVMEGNVLKEITGWTNENFNKPVQGNNTVGYASECYAGWGNLDVKTYKLTQKIKLPKGKYTLVNYSFYRYGLNADTDASLSYAFLKAGNQQVPIKTLGSIAASGYANSQAEGANAFDSKMYRNTLDFTIEADNTEIEIGLVGTHELKQSWMICGMFELINNDILATMDAPFDVTGYLTNPGFEYRDMTGWTQSPESFFQAQGNNQGFKVGGFYGEKWQGSGALPGGSMSQTLNNLPAGYYMLTANLGGNGTYIDLNGKKASWTEDKDYTVGYVLSTDEALTVTAGKTAEGTANWIHFDNFRLQFCGDVRAALTTLCAKVSEYESKLPADKYSALKTAVGSYDKDYADGDEVLAALDAVQQLYSTADAFLSYTAAKAAAEAVLNNKDYENVKGTERTNLNSAISAVVNVNTEEAYNSAKKAITDAQKAFTDAAPHYNAYVQYRTETEGAFGKSLTSEIVEPSTAAEADVAVQTMNIAQYNEVSNKYKFSCAGVIGDFGTWTGTATVAGAEAEPNYLDWEHWSGKLHAYYEQASNGWGDPKGWTIKYEKKCRLPKGKYVLKVAARSSAGTTSKVTCSATEVTVTLPNVGASSRGIATNGVASWSDEDTFANGNVNDNEPTVGGRGSGWQWRFLPFELTAMTEVTMTFEASASSQYQWMSISDGDLLSLENIAKDVSYSEEGNYEIESHDIANVSMIRTIKEGFNTLVLPFSLTSKQVEETFGEGTVIYNFSENSENANAAKIKFQKGDGSITANKPVLVKAANASKKQNFVGVRVEYSPEVKVAGKNFDFIGSYRMGWIDEGNYFVGNGALYKSEGNTFSNAFRAYIKPKTAGARVESFEIEGEGEATGIKAVETSSRINNGKIYNLNGQEVKNGQKGIFIQNGKKFILR